MPSSSLLDAPHVDAVDPAALVTDVREQLNRGEVVSAEAAGRGTGVEAT